MAKISETRYSLFLQKSGYFFKFFKKQSKQGPKINNTKIIIKFFMQGHFHSLKSLFEVLQVVGVIYNYLNNSSSSSLLKSRT